MTNEENEKPAQRGVKEETGAVTAEKKPAAFKKFVKHHPVLTTALAGLLLVLIVYGWKDIQGNLERKTVVKAANVTLQDNAGAMLKVMAKPIVWSIRSEMIRGNLEQVELLMTDMVKGSGMQYIQLVSPDGKVLISTDKLMQGQPLSDEEVGSVLKSDTTVLLNNQKSNTLTVVSPVMGYDKRLGTLVMRMHYTLFDPLKK